MIDDRCLFGERIESIETISIDDGCLADVFITHNDDFGCLDGNLATSSYSRLLLWRFNLMIVMLLLGHNIA